MSVDPWLAFLAMAGVVWVAVGTALYAALHVAVFLTHGAGVLQGDSGFLAGGTALMFGAATHPWTPWVGYPGLRTDSAPDPVLFWTIAVVVAVGITVALAYPAATVYRWLFPAAGNDTHGKARWASRRDLARATSLRAPGGLDPNGLVLGWWGRQVVQSRLEDNVLVVGVSRSGKTSSVVIPTLLAWRGSAIATSTKTELVRLTGPYRRRLGGRVGVFAPLDEDQSWIAEMGLERVTWNPISSIRSVGTAAELADIFTADGKRTEAAHWYLGAANLLTGLFLVARQRLGADAGTGDIRDALSLLNRTRLEDYPGLALEVEDPVAKEMLKAIASTPEREAGSIISTARNALSLWYDNRVEAATAAGSADELDITAFLREGGTLYLVAPLEDAERCRPLFSALLQTIMRSSAARAQRSRTGILDPRLLLALDEVANFVRIPRLASYVSTGPGQGIQTLLCFQDLAQIEGGYGQSDSRSIMNNCRTRLLMPGQGDLGTLDAFSRALGQTTTIYQATGRNAEGKAVRSEQRLASPLAAPEVLRRMKHPVLIAGQERAARLTAKGWWQVPAWRSLVQS